jgi:hypothetical protein
MSCFASSRNGLYYSHAMLIRSTTAQQYASIVTVTYYAELGGTRSTAAVSLTPRVAARHQHKAAAYI